MAGLFCVRLNGETGRIQLQLDARPIGKYIQTFKCAAVDYINGGLKEQVQQSVNFLSLLSETIPLPKHRYQWASDRTELT
jgi:hypothetical protein